MPDEHEPARDPLDLDAVDHAIRINELNEQVKELGMSSFHVSEDCPSGVHEQFLQNIVDYETGPLSCHLEALEKAGVEMPEPKALDDAALYAKLWEVINALAKMDAFISHTDHMSDRQLYEHLWQDTLREQSPIMPAGSGWMCHYDLISSGSEEDIQVGLRYYDTEEDRQSWAKDFPDMAIPPHEALPYDRDRLLPGASPSLDSDDADDADETEEA